ncbi:LTA synthase family protein [Roseimaritima ulvae]|uniref:Sulfatase n=1 Tax=Roseimaritima ulvae TaxID=980254 RepID=A0A5B9QH26_9BACT|nr:sulfatase-like hydrolase/transferase [Roseimaritima ulvae]QEG38358.1 Sulfatase [Roseimaritima ulvae]
MRKVPVFITSLEAQFENLRAWGFLVMVGLMGQLIWLYQNSGQLPAVATARDYMRFAVTAVRYDIEATTYLLLPWFVFASLLVFVPSCRSTLTKLRRWTVVSLGFLLPVLAFANAVYYQTFQDVFDEFLFDFSDGNASDVIGIAYHELGLVSKSVISLCLGTGLWWVYTRRIERPVELSTRTQRMFQHRFAQIMTSALIIAVVAVALRGRIGKRPLQRTDCAVTSYRILNLGTLHPVTNLKDAWKSRKVRQEYFAEHRRVPPAKLRAHLAALAEVNKVAARESVPSMAVPVVAPVAGLAFQAPSWQRTAAGAPNGPPEHVFVLFMESYDSWPFLEPYRELGLVNNGRQFGEQGHLLLNYVPGANSSLLSSLVCLQGLYDTYRERQECLPTSIVSIFQRLGYRTRSINSFPSEWGDSERIARQQGFDEIYCTADIKPGGDTNNMQIHDRTLFEFVAERLAYDEPTISFIRSSSYHGPFEVDLAAEGCELGPLPESICQLGVNDEDNLRLAYGTLKYSDKMMGEFVRKMIARYPNSLFVITGDHYGRHFPTINPPPYEGCSVPLILYGPKVLAGTSIPDNMAASHADLPATLAELCAPRGFSYLSLGKSVLAPCQDPVGVGEDHVIFSDAMVSLRTPAQCVRAPWWDGKPLSSAQAEAIIQKAREIHDAYHKVGYMLARRSLEAAAERIATRDQAADRY